MNTQLPVPKCPNAGSPCFCTGQCKPANERTASASELLDGFLKRGCVKHTAPKREDEFYFYKGNIYRRVDEISVKNEATRAWDVHVLYQNVEGLMYSREVGDFYAKFTQVNADSVAVSKFKAINLLCR